MKKNMFVALVMSLVLLFVSACAANTKEGKAEEAASETDKPIEIEYWFGLGSEAGKKMEGIIQSFNESQDNYVVKGVSQASYDETYQKLQAAIASDTAPGVFITGGAQMHDLASKEAITPLNDFLEENDAFNEDDFLDVFINPTKIDDSYYGLPAYGTTQVMYYRKDLYEKAGIDPEEAFSSWENLAEASKEIQEQGVADFGHLPMWDQNNLIDLALSSGGTILNEDGTEVMIDEEAWVASWDFIRKQIHEEKTMKVNSGGQGWEYWYKTIDEVMNGSATSYTGSSGDKGNLDFEIIDSTLQPGFNGNEGKPIVEGLFMAVPESIADEEKEAAVAFMNYFTSPEVNADWAQAIGYIPVKHTAMDVPEYKTFIEENPYAGVPFEQAQIGTSGFIDPTGGKIIDALSIAADKVELENIPAEEALKEADKAAQKALDEVNQ
ncbi:ABC transporter substrate-binding protein [Pontibacillus litoralis]|uniref:ABC transporter substrate-binding protein n=1 Tax=Pontibacillus litoralis JSM 072002 TaxID=1385512 RepID=A0A0A5HTT4_9BACI|nr:ABC transporter substrate-binding protein [Pontibacillus litoralis]KGX87002.1 ABC transporter substrate-binding protein [Pontibacillus litoralis JSM 072002]